MLTEPKGRVRFLDDPERSFKEAGLSEEEKNTTPPVE